MLNSLKGPFISEYLMVFFKGTGGDNTILPVLFLNLVSFTGFSIFRSLGTEVIREGHMAL
jgi:hypothetical protein